MRGKRAKLAAFAAKYNHKTWRDRINVLKYGKPSRESYTLICSADRQRYKAFKTFIKLRRSAPHAKSMGNGEIIRKLHGEKAYKRWRKRGKNDMATTAGSIMQTALQKIGLRKDAPASSLVLSGE